jgi:hypothetical protein
VKLKGLKRDVTELTHMLNITKKLNVKEVTQMNIALLLAKRESLKDIFSEQFETNLLWEKVVARNVQKTQAQSKGLCIIYKQYQIITTYCVMIQITKRLRDLNSKGIRRDKMKNHKWRVVENKSHKVIITVNSHGRGCASKVKQLLYTNFEVLGFVNPGSGMKFI